MLSLEDFMRKTSLNKLTIGFLQGLSLRSIKSDNQIKAMRSKPVKALRLSLFYTPNLRNYVHVLYANKDKEML